MNEKTKKCLGVMRNHEKTLMAFNRHGDDGTDFHPFSYSKPKEEGIYLTIRCGFTGIYTMLNEWKDGEWQVECADGSTTIAYRKDQAIIDELNPHHGNTNEI